MAPNEDGYPESGLWKDYVARERIEEIAQTIGKTYRKFDQKGFVEAVLDDGFEKLELKTRIGRIAETLKPYLPNDFKKAVAILTAAAPSLPGFGNWAITDFVALNGLEHFDASVKALKILTRHGSAEFAIRPFMIRYTDRIMPLLHEWAEDSNEHVRRLAAEGSRPRGVWVAHIESFKQDPAPVIELLEKLKADESLYVRKAVANNLNDISKDNPETVIDTATVWQEGATAHTRWIIKHACRTLIKQRHPAVFGLLGFTPNPKTSVESFRTSKKRVRIGSEFVVSADISSRAKKSQKLAVDYVVHYVKKNGKASPKVFKFAEKTIKPGETLSLSTKHSFREMTTRKHYPGDHSIELVINGRVVDRTEFKLTK